MLHHRWPWRILDLLPYQGSSSLVVQYSRTGFHLPEGEEEEAEALEDTARFVADLVEERLVLAYRRGWLTGGSEFIEPTELTPERRRRLEWVASWRGTYDWKVPE